MANGAPRWSRLAHDERSAQILRVARRLFSQRHYGAVSTTEIAREAGVARGLLHHYFGTKRELYLEVLRSMLRMPPEVLGEPETAGRDREEVLGDAVDRWLEMVGRNRGTWLATVGSQGFGRDPEVEAILEEAREEITDQLIALLSLAEPEQASRELRALVRAYAGFAETASLEWLLRRELTREQVHELLLTTLLALVSDVLPRVERVGDPAPRRRAAIGPGRRTKAA